MPPRRSSRRPSVEPTSVATASTVSTVSSGPASKRKRQSTAEPEELSTISSKPSRGSRRSAGRAAAGSSRGDTIGHNLNDVPEDDNEDDLRPVKKSRSAQDDDEDDDFEEEEEVKPKRGRAAAKPLSKPARSRKPTKEVDPVAVSSDEEDVKPAPKSRSRGGSTSKVAAAIRSSRAASKSRRASGKRNEPIVIESDSEPMPIASKRGRGRLAQQVEPPTLVKEEEGEEEEERQPTPPPPAKRGRRRPTNQVTPPLKEEEDEDEIPVLKTEATSDEEEELVTPTKPSRLRSNVPQPDGSPVEEDDEEDEVEAHLSHVVDDDEDEDEYEGMPPPAQLEPQTQPVDEEEEYEEKSLLDPPDIPPASPRKRQVTPEEPKGPQARLVIHKMALINFKSYAGRQEIGPFHKSFSAIVGPNGSGKSNTIDALLFVFGYRASKMRQGKLSELIHNSAGHEDLDFCAVEVHFREIIDLPGPDAYEIVPNSGLVVARTAYSNNSSKYTINGNQSNFTEVTTLLKARGIDLDHKRFLILQGEVESIALMKPKAPSEHEDGLLEYLEDIIGTSAYKKPIEDALAAMDALAEERAEKLNRLRITEREKNVLEEQKREAEDYLRLQNEWVRARSRLLQWYIWRCLQNEDEYRKKIDEVDAELKQAREENKDDIAYLEELETHYSKREEAYQEIKTAAAEAEKDLKAHEKTEVSLQEKSKAANTKTQKLTKSLKSDEQAKQAALRAIEDNGDKIKREGKKLKEHEASLEKEEKILEEIRDSLKDKTQVFHNQIEVKQKELQPWTMKINAKQAEVNVAQSERDTLAKKAESIKDALAEAAEKEKELREEHQTKSNDLQNKKRELQEAREQLDEGERQLQGLSQQVNELRGKASSSRQRVDEAKSSQSQASSQNRVLDFLMNMKNTGRIQGFHGRLGSLGTIPDQYDVAVTTSSGTLNNMVVDTVEQAQACIDLLRKHNVGRASFLMLDKLPHNPGMNPMQTPENVPRLFDLIKPKEPRFAPAFYKAVFNTVVAKDLEQANRIAFGGAKRWRVVTIAGALIDTSGAMSGGGGAPRGGGMSSKLAPDTVSPQVLRQYEQDSEKAARDLQVVQERFKEVEGEVEQLRTVVPQIQMTISKIELDLRNGEQRINEASKRVRDLKAQSKPDAGDLARIAALDKSIKASTATLEDLQEKSGSIEEDIKALEKKIIDIGGSRLLAQKSKVEGISLHIKLANDEITKAEVAKARAEKDSTKFDSAIANNTEALEALEAELEDIETQLEECTSYVNEIRKKVDQAKEAEDASKEDLENLKAELDEKTEGIQAFRKKEMELQQTLTDLQKEAQDNDRNMTHWQEEHDKLELEDIDDDEEEEDSGNQPTQSGDPIVKSEPGEDGASKPKPSSNSSELHIYSEDELRRFRKKEMMADVELLDEKLKNSKPDMNVLKEYRRREEEYLRRHNDLEETTARKDAQKAEYDQLCKKRLDEFMAGFNAISLKLKEMYQMITLGGNAELELVDSMDPFSEGIIFSVMPPKKSWKNISNLSGGEKTLSSLALVFALHHFKPTPLYFMDEIDAALDFRNVSIVANYIKDRTKNAQFIIISLRNDMFELSHRLIGIYKTANTTKSISINNHALSAKTTNAQRGARVAPSNVSAH